MKVEITCCEGNDPSGHACLKNRCPIYRSAQSVVRRGWPYCGTGFGNLYGEPTHNHFLNQVREDLRQNPKPS